MAARALALAVVISLVTVTVPYSSSAQIIEIPECGIDLPVTDPFCQLLCEIEDPPPAYCSTEPERDPIVLVPPLIASFNKKLMMQDEEGGEFKFVFSGNTFKGLINKLEEAGYEVDHDLFIAHYDWRQSNALSAQQYLKPIIDTAKQATGASKVDIIAHSMGGLVARSYIQSNTYDNDVDQLITLGTPHAGSAGAYLAWEGGIFPETWDLLIKIHVGRIEKALQKTRNMKDATRPTTFRTFFPSLKELLPIDNYVTKQSTSVAVESLTEQNSFLQNLRATFNRTAVANVKLTTIASTNVDTLKNINVGTNRTGEDESLNRWRDGHANPDPPTTDSTAGDETVLLSSAQLGINKITLNNIHHIDLPDSAQDEVLEALDLEEVEEQFNSDTANSLLGFTILSPVDAVLQGPGNKILSKNRNDFGPNAAEYDDDPNDPEDPKVVTLANPPNGEYTITYTGTGSGDYRIITQYGDSNEVVTSTEDGATTNNEKWVEKITIGGATSSLTDDSDYKKLLEQVIALAKKAKKDKLLKGFEEANITRPMNHAESDLKQYEHRLTQGRKEAARDRLRSYYQNLEELKRVAQQLAAKSSTEVLAEELLQLIEKIIVASPPLGT